MYSLADISGGTHFATRRIFPAGRPAIQIEDWSTDNIGAGKRLSRVVNITGFKFNPAGQCALSDPILVGDAPGRRF